MSVKIGVQKYKRLFNYENVEEKRYTSLNIDSQHKDKSIFNNAIPLP
jgi:hypothetical protein